MRRSVVPLITLSITTGLTSDADLCQVESTQLREKILNSAMFPIVPAVADARHGSAILSLVYLALAYRPLGRLIVAEAIRKRHIPPAPVDLAGHLLNVVKGLPSAIAVSSDFLWRRYMTKSRLPGFFIRSKISDIASRIIRNKSRNQIAE